MLVQPNEFIPVELLEVLQRLKANCLGGVRSGTELRVQCEIVLCDVSEPAGPACASV